MNSLSRKCRVQRPLLRSGNRILSISFPTLIQAAEGKKFGEILSGQDDKSLVLFWGLYGSMEAKLTGGGMTMPKETAEKPAGIKIKINGKESSFSEHVEVHHWQDALQESAAAEEALPEESFEWQLPEPGGNEIKEYKKIHYNSDKKRKPARSFSARRRIPGLARLIAAVGASVLIGLLFGFLMLSIVNAPGSDKTAHLSGQITPDERKPEVSPASASPSIPSMKLAVLQGGVFSSSETAEQARREASEKGLPAETFLKEGQYVLLIGLAKDIDHAKKRGQELKEQGIDVYAKEMTLFGGGEERVADTADAGLQADAARFGSLAAALAEAHESGSISGRTAEALQKAGRPDKKNGQVSSSARKLAELEEVSRTELLAFKKSGNAGRLTAAEQALLTAMKLLAARN